MEEEEEWKEKIEFDGVMITVDDSDLQRLWIRVGPMYVKGQKYPEPVVWIEYQELGMGSQVLGPVLISSEGWKEINRIVQERLDDHQN